MQSAGTSSKCDLVYLAHGRPEFTAASLAALGENTNWERVGRMLIYTDGALMRNGMVPPPSIPLHLLSFCHKHVGGPVGTMNDYLANSLAPIWAKIDNDVIVPPGWLDACLAVMDDHDELDLLGIEPPLSRTPAPWSGGVRAEAPENYRGLRADGWPTYARCEAIGGIGLFRSRAWQGRREMVPHSTYGGFTDWQLKYRAALVRCGIGNPLVIGWIVPPLKLFLLDRLPMGPWASLSAGYIAAKEQRTWTNYSTAEAHKLAGWWLK